MSPIINMLLTDEKFKKLKERLGYKNLSPQQKRRIKLSYGWELEGKTCPKCHNKAWISDQKQPTIILGGSESSRNTCWVECQRCGKRSFLRPSWEKALATF